MLAVIVQQVEAVEFFAVDGLVSELKVVPSLALGWGWVSLLV